MLTSSSINHLIYREMGNPERYFDHYFTSPMKSYYEPSQVTFKTEIPGSSSIWLGSRYNFIISLDSRGRVTLYNNLLNNQGTVIINSPSHAFKCLMNDEYLFIIYKQSPSQTCLFAKYSWSELQISKINPIKIMHQVQVPITSIIELNHKDLTLSLIQNESLQIWSLESNSLVQQFSYSPDLTFHYHSGILIFFQTTQSSTLFGILNKGNLKTFSFNLTNQVYFCELVNEKLVIGMQGCHLQIVDIETLDIKVIEKGVPKQVFYLPINDLVFVVFPNQEVCVVDSECKFFKLQGQNFTCCETEGQILVTSQDDFSYLNWASIGIKKVGKRLVAMGINPDTRQIICAEKGQVHIFE